MLSIRAKREQLGMSMTELAARVHMDLSKLSRLERGQLKLKVDDVAKLARALGCAPGELIPACEDVLAPTAEVTP